jgi:hypothetical protein
VSCGPKEGGPCKEGVDGVEESGAGAGAEAMEREWKERGGVRSLFWFAAECGVPALFLERLAIWLRRSYTFSKVLCLLTDSKDTIYTISTDISIYVCMCVCVCLSVCLSVCVCVCVCAY